jgi:hypothetical protein
MHRGAGTDANVSIEIHGDKAFIGATKLENHKVQQMTALVAYNNLIYTLAFH